MNKNLRDLFTAVGIAVAYFGAIYFAVAALFPELALNATLRIIPEMIRGKSSTKLFERVRQLAACENRGKHHIFIRVQDAAGQGINSLKELTN